MQQKPIRIALIGEANAGKNTICDYLESTYGFNQFAISQIIKEEGDSLAWKWRNHSAFKEDRTLKNPDFRLFLEGIGKLIGEEKLIETVFSNLAPCDRSVIDNVYNIEQMNYLLALDPGYIIIDVRRQGISAATVLHNNELEKMRNLGAPAYQILNAGSKESLYRIVDVIVADILGDKFDTKVFN